MDLNREGGIGSNSLYIELGPFKFVVDAGLHPKRVGLRAAPDFTQIENVELDFIVVTHCHLDHIGALPLLLKNRPDTPVLMSHPSQMLVERMLHNSCNVMKRQKAEQSIPEYPLFSHEEIEAIAAQFEICPFEKTLTVESGEEALKFTLHRAGHVAGAGGFEIEFADKKYFFTGDVLFDDQRILDGADFPDKKNYDTIVIETTRGETESNPEKTRQSEVDRLLKTIVDTLHRGGSVLIPVFALGRMQEIITIIDIARKNGEIPRCPVYGAGLGLDIANYFDHISKRTEQLKFSRRSIKEIGLKRPPRNIPPGKEPAEQGIFILSSGMMVERTPSYNVAASLLHGSRNTFCFVGYCDPDTPGGKLLAAGPGDEFIFEAIDYQTKIRAQIERFEMSGHADREEILDFALETGAETIVLTHGDEGARQWFANRLKSARPSARIIDPKPLKSYEV
ncbi:MAG: MBL fold metallo-hydrolase [Verrucomicrobiota bacterium]